MLRVDVSGTRQGMPKMQGRPELEVYVGAKGHVCIKQEDPTQPPRDYPTITLEPEQVPTVIAWLQEVLPEASKIFTNVDEDTDTDED